MDRILRNVASAYLTGVVNNVEEYFRKVVKAFAEQKMWYSDAPFQSIRNVFNGTYLNETWFISSIVALHRS